MASFSDYVVYISSQIAHDEVFSVYESKIRKYDISKDSDVYKSVKKTLEKFVSDFLRDVEVSVWENDDDLDLLNREWENSLPRLESSMSKTLSDIDSEEKLSDKDEENLSRMLAEIYDELRNIDFASVARSQQSVDLETLEDIAESDTPDLEEVERVAHPGEIEIAKNRKKQILMFVVEEAAKAFVDEDKSKSFMEKTLTNIVHRVEDEFFSKELIEQYSLKILSSIEWVSPRIAESALGKTLHSKILKMLGAENESIREKISEMFAEWAVSGKEPRVIQ